MTILHPKKKVRQNLHGEKIRDEVEFFIFVSYNTMLLILENLVNVTQIL